MEISLSSKTGRLLEKQMKSRRFRSPDELVRTALQTLEQAQGEDIEDLDEETQAALDRAFTQSRRGEGRPWAEVREELRKKYLGA